MPTITHPIEVDIPGPWLIEKKELIRLDSIFDECEEKMRAEREGLLDGEVEEDLSALSKNRSYTKEQLEMQRKELRARAVNRLGNDIRKVSIYLSGGRSVTGRTFEELARAPELQSEEARGFVATAGVKPFEVRVTLDSGFLGPRLGIKTKPDNEDLSKLLFGILQSWQDDFAPPRWQQLWAKFAWLFGGFLLMWMLGWCLAILQISTSSGDLAKSNAQTQARELLKQGVNSSNQTRAIELLLQIEAEYTPQPSNSERISTRSRLIAVLGSLALLLLWKCPTMALGIWSGKKKLKRYQLFIKFVAVSVPTSIASTLIWPWIVNALGLKL